ncbi:TPA: DUF3955 domain-containing protein [Enterobacter cloacae]
MKLNKSWIALLYIGLLQLAMYLWLTPPYMDENGVLHDRFLLVAGGLVCVVVAFLGIFIPHRKP